jgi:hypothetical protein
LQIYKTRKTTVMILKSFNLKEKRTNMAFENNDLDPVLWLSL